MMCCVGIWLCGIDLWECPRPVRTLPREWTRWSPSNTLNFTTQFFDNKTEVRIESIFQGSCGAISVVRGKHILDIPCAVLRIVVSYLPQDSFQRRFSGGRDFRKVAETSILESFASCWMISELTAQGFSESTSPVKSIGKGKLKTPLADINFKAIVKSPASSSPHITVTIAVRKIKMGHLFPVKLGLDLAGYQKRYFTVQPKQMRDISLGKMH
ncbi:hypothetical protein Pelo_790 [Pelomyxa schiedti]|nr:hypothetical protein Pelo_790 [Pelomyxa schiedti]